MRSGGHAPIMPLTPQAPTTEEHTMTAKNIPATQTGIAVSTAITDGFLLNHAEGIVVSTSLKAGPTPQSIRCIDLRSGAGNHAEGIVVA